MTITHRWKSTSLVLVTLAILGSSFASAEPVLFVSPNVVTLDFGTTTVDTPISRFVYLQNVGTSDLHIYSIVTTGEFSNYYLDNGFPIPPSGAITVELYMDAESVGSQSGTVTYNTNEPYNRVQQALTGIVEPGDPGMQVFMATPNADAFIRQEQPGNNFGSEEILRIRGGDTGLARFSFLRFNLPSFTGNVQSAVLRIRPKIKTITSARVYDVNIGWGENTINWNNWRHGGTTFTFLRDTGSLAAEQWHEIDVREAIPAGGGTVNIGLATFVDTFGFRFYSRESAFVPTLEVTVQ